MSGRRVCVSVAPDRHWGCASQLCFLRLPARSSRCALCLSILSHMYCVSADSTAAFRFNFLVKVLYRLIFCQLFRLLADRLLRMKRLGCDLRRRWTVVSSRWDVKLPFFQCTCIVWGQQGILRYTVLPYQTLYNLLLTVAWRIKGRLELLPMHSMQASYEYLEAAF